MRRPSAPARPTGAGAYVEWRISPAQTRAPQRVRCRSPADDVPALCGRRSMGHRIDERRAMFDRPTKARNGGDPSALERLASFAQRHHWTAMLVWLTVLGATTVIGQVVGSNYDNDFALPGTQSQQMADLMDKHAPTQSGDTVTIVLHDPRGWNADIDMTALTRDLAAIDHVEQVTAPDARRGTVSSDGTTALAQVMLEGNEGDTPLTTFDRIIDVAESHQGDRARIELSGNGIRQVEGGGGSPAEAIGMLAALAILILMFGSFLAASLPLITAVLAVGSMFGVAALLSHVLTLPDFSTAMLALVGLGVGIDYALLIFSRYRSELLTGADRVQATRTALDTAGRSVLFAGASVIIALGGLFTL